jgi:type III restriction enzyme
VKLQFKTQTYQTAAVNAVVDCFAGQPHHDPARYRIDPGVGAQLRTSGEDDDGYRNADLVLSATQLLANVRTVQARQHLEPSPLLVPSKAGPLNLDVEMETGTGKTYVYIKTIMEMNKRYGWSKFIVVVPSVAIREGVAATFTATAAHFQDAYGHTPRPFVYSSRALHELESFSSDAGIGVMIINIQAFASKGKDNRRIYDALDDFGSRRPIDVIAANRPVVILDEPQRIGSDTALASLSDFKPLFLLRYSATHKVTHNKVHRLDALDAYDQKLVKKIAVRGITVRGLQGTEAYLYLDGIDVKTGSEPTARIELEEQIGRDIKRRTHRVRRGTNLHDLSREVEAYKPHGQPLIVTDIDAVRDVLTLNNGGEVHSGQITHDVTDTTKRRIQIREVIDAHLAKEAELFGRGVKVLSLFFIDEVAKYRDYAQEDTKGEYARVFEQEYEEARERVLAELPFDEAYRTHLAGIAAAETHAGYFSIDKSGRSVDGEVRKTGDEKGQSVDVDAYDLILKQKERLLSYEEKTRFLFSHSALREGWDNPNVFVMGMLKKSDNTISRRQEIGRGLRLSVDQQGNRVDDPSEVHEVNELTVVTDESYTDFVAGLQREISESLSARPRVASVEYFVGKRIELPTGFATIDTTLARAIEKYLIRNDYLNADDTLAQSYRLARAAGTTAAPTDPALTPVVMDLVWPIIDALYLDLPVPGNGRATKQNPTNANLDRAEFQELWRRINRKAVYQVEFDSDELTTKCVHALDTQLKVEGLQYTVELGRQKARVTADDLAAGTGFDRTSSTVDDGDVKASQVQYDLIGEIKDKTRLSRRTVAAVLRGIRPPTFALFARNPEQFITEVGRLVNEQKATMILERLTYNTLDERYDSAIFTAGPKLDLSRAIRTDQRHVYDYLVPDSTVEADFAAELEISSNVVVYAKLPRGFLIPTPMGDYNPDWAIAFTQATVKHVYFVAETKGSLSTLQLRDSEQAKINCARAFFAALAARADNGDVRYDVVTDFAQLRQLVSQL